MNGHVGHHGNNNLIDIDFDVDVNGAKYIHSPLSLIICLPAASHDVNSDAFFLVFSTDVSHAQFPSIHRRTKITALTAAAAAAVRSLPQVASLI